MKQEKINYDPFKNDITPKSRQTSGHKKNFRKSTTTQTVKMTAEKMLSCLHNLDTCFDYHLIVDQYLKLIDDIRLDKNGLIIWLNADPSNGLKLIMLLWMKKYVKDDMVANINGKFTTPREMEMLSQEIIFEIRKLKKKRQELIKHLHCLSYFNFFPWSFWREFLNFTYVGPDDKDSIASDLMIFVLYFPEANKEMLVEFVLNTWMGEDFISHIKRYSDVIRYHRGLFIQSLSEMKDETLDLEKATNLSEQWLKYTYWNIFSERYKLTNSGLINILTHCPFQKIKNELVELLIWKMDCNKERDSHYDIKNKFPVLASYLKEKVSYENPELQESNVSIISSTPRQTINSSSVPDTFHKLTTRPTDTRPGIEAEVELTKSDFSKLEKELGI